MITNDKIEYYWTSDNWIKRSDSKSMNKFEMISKKYDYPTGGFAQIDEVIYNINRNNNTSTNNNADDDVITDDIVKLKEVNYIVANTEEFEELKEDILIGELIWVVNENNDWNIYKKISDDSYQSMRFNTVEQMFPKPFNFGDSHEVYDVVYISGNKFYKCIKRISAGDNINVENDDYWTPFIYSDYNNSFPIYQNNTEYNKGQVVIVQKILFKCIRTPQNHEKYNDSDYWEEYKEIDLDNTYPFWNATDDYTVGDIVATQKVYYQCMQDTEGQSYENTDYWKKYKVKGDSYYITNDEFDEYISKLDDNDGNKGKLNISQKLIHDNEYMIGNNISTWGVIYIHQYINDEALNDKDKFYNCLSLVRVQNYVPDASTIRSCYLVDDKTDETLVELQVYNPLQGIFPNNVLKEIDYIIGVDPADYNDSNKWGRQKIGQLWWDTSKVKFLDFCQGDEYYRRKYWGKQLPGSEIAVYEWTQTLNPPNVDKYVIENRFNINTLTMETYYYYWVKNPSTIPDVGFRKISAYNISSIINDPTNAGISWIAPIKAINAGNNYGSFIISNFNESTTGAEFVVQINFKNNENVSDHAEWTIIRRNSSQDVIPYLWKKMKDSLLGIDDIGNIVPDPSLTVENKYGLNIRPRQSMFESLYEARKDFVSIVNSIFNSRDVKIDTDVDDAEFNSILADYDKRYVGNYDLSVTHHYELFTATDASLVGMKVLVTNDEVYDGIWTLWEVIGITDEGTKCKLLMYETYDVRKYWKYINLYADDYNESKPIKYTTKNLTNLFLNYNLNVGDYFKLLDSSTDWWAICNYLGNKSYEIVARENATINITDNLYEYMVDKGILKDDENGVIFIDNMTKYQYLTKEVIKVITNILYYFEQD